MNIDWIKLICEVIIPVVGIIVTSYVVPWLKQQRIWQEAKEAVLSAEQIFAHGDNEAKYEYASGILAKAFKMDADDARRVIEAAVAAFTK